jgi:hypothetical protein
MRRIAAIGGLSIGLCVVHVVGCGSDSANPTSTAGAAGAGAGTFVGSGGGGGTSAGAGAGGESGFVGSTGGGASVSDSGFQDPDAGCAVQKQESKPVPTDIFIMLDKSVSMNCPTTDAACNNPTTAVPPTRWTAVTEGIKAFATAPSNDGIGIGLGIFAPTGDMCSPQTYATEATPIAPLPAGGTTVLNRIAATQPAGITPTLWSLQGAILYVQQYMAANPTKTAAIVYVTDGMPNSPKCPSTVQGAADVAKAAYDAKPSIETYVVGMGATATLDQIALAGSGGSTHYIDANGDTATKLRDLLKLVSHAITCDHPIPATTTALNFDAVDVQTRVSDTAPTTTLKYVTSAGACASTPAWYYDVLPPGTPTKITLCPSACDPLKGVDTASVQVVIGCAPRIN